MPGEAHSWGKAFPQQVSGKVHVETWAGGCPTLNLKISQEQEIEGRCAVVRFPPRIPFVTPALPGPACRGSVGEVVLPFLRRCLEGIVPHSMGGSL